MFPVLLSALEMLLSALWSAKMQMFFTNLSTLLLLIHIIKLVILKKYQFVLLTAGVFTSDS